MKYVFLLYSDENVWDAKPSEEKGEIINGYMAYTEALTKAGAFIAGEPLDHTRNARRVRSAGAEDGPFADGKEQLGGFYMIEADNLDTALDWAAKCPAASDGHVEVRPVWNIGG
ncbi:MAG: YciI family protein [Pseudomonadota bacterium]